MNLIFFALNAVFAVPDNRIDELWLKLEKYQNITGISDEIKTMIWQKSASARAGIKQGHFHYISSKRWFFIQSIYKIV